jgi:ABC-type polysaccharide/polyol phosphate export permease
MNLVKNAFYLAWMDTKARYKKSILGPFWLTLSNLIGVLGLSVVWGNLLKEDMTTFVPSLSLGLIIWQLIAGVIGDAPTTFVRQANVMRNVAIPTWFFALRALARHFINLLHNLLIVFGVIWYFDLPINFVMLLSIVGLFLVLANLFWFTYLIGILGARFRDIEYLITSVLPILFFISPVIFHADKLPPSMNIIWANPLSYMIEIIRSPFLGKIPALSTYIIVVSILFCGGVLTYFVHARQGKRLAFWI